MGQDGFIGHSLTKSLLARGDQIWGIDNLLRRRLVQETGGDSLVPIPSVEDRKQHLKALGNVDFTFTKGDLTDYSVIHSVISQFNPDTIVHLGEIPSAPYSMRGIKEACFTQVNNITSTLNLLFAVRDINPNIQILKIATLGEIGAPKISVPEGKIEIEYKGKKDLLTFPKSPMSVYHSSKCADSINIELACKCWGLNVTNIFQGIVFHTHLEGPDWINHSSLVTRLDICDFGTVLHRFCAQAILEHPLTVYGSGTQQRGFLPLRDSIRCLTLLIDHPAQGYRAVNQLADVVEVNKLARMVRDVAWDGFQLQPELVHLENPRVEAEHHNLIIERKILDDLGYAPAYDLHGDIFTLIHDLIPYRGRIEKLKHLLIPTTQWSGQKKKSEIIQV